MTGSTFTKTPGVWIFAAMENSRKLICPAHWEALWCPVNSVRDDYTVRDDSRKLCHSVFMLLPGLYRSLTRRSFGLPQYVFQLKIERYILDKKENKAEVKKSNGKHYHIVQYHIYIYHIHAVLNKHSDWNLIEQTLLLKKQYIVQTAMHRQ